MPELLDVAYALLVEEFTGDGRAVVASGGEERPPAAFRAMVDTVLTMDAPDDVERFVSKEERELRDALGVK